jgi:hypothetical protein
MIRSAAVATLLLALFVIAMLRAGEVRLDGRSLLAIGFGAATVSVAGVVVVRLSLAALVTRVDLIVLAGSIISSVAVAAGSLATEQRAGRVFAGFSVVVGAAAVALRRSRVHHEPGSPSWLREAAAVGAVAVVAALYSGQHAGFLPTLESSGMARGWSDHFIHAAHIGEFAGRATPALSSYLLAGEPIHFYHYAPYMLPAALAGIIDAPALAFVGTILIPHGALLTALAVYALVRTLANLETALIAAAALLLVPDPSSYGLRNGFLGFHWMLFTSPGGFYGLAGAFLALTWLVLWRTTPARACGWMALLVTLAIVQLRAQILVLFAPSAVAALAMETQAVRQSGWRLIRPLAVALAGGLLVVVAVPDFHEPWRRFSAAPELIEFVHTMQAPTAYDGVYRAMAERLGTPVALSIGWTMLVPAMLGALTLVSLPAFAAAVRRSGTRPLDWFPLCCLACWLGLVLVAPRGADGDIGQYQHRPFVLVYAAAFVWTTTWLARLFRSPEVSWTGHWQSVRFAVIATATIIAAAIAPGERARPTFAWGTRYYGLPIDRGVLDAAAFIRARAGAGDTLAVLPVNTVERPGDPATVLVSLTDVPAYVALPGYEVLREPHSRALVKRRFGTLRSVEASHDLGTAMARLGGEGVTFLVVLGPEGPDFDPARSGAAWSSARAAVYRVPRPYAGGTM